MRVIFFGVLERDRPGHFTHEVGNGDRHGYEALVYQLGGVQLDAGLAPKGVGEQQGAATLQEFNGWTVLAWWDRSGGDRRNGSNSALIVEGSHPLADMVALLAEHFPDVAARQRAPWIV